jgi:hypothetical protein
VTFDRAFRIATVFATALPLAGCIFVATPRDRAVRHTPSFEAGYDDGCAAATDVGASYRHPPEPNPAYKNDDVYHAGWSNGFNTCRRTISPPGSDLGNPVPQPSPGH